MTKKASKGYNSFMISSTQEVVVLNKFKATKLIFSIIFIFSLIFSVFTLIDTHQKNNKNSFEAKTENSSAVNLHINKIDTSNFPKIKLSISIDDGFGKYIVDSNIKNYIIHENPKDKSKTNTITKISPLKNDSPLSIAFAVDKSQNMTSNDFFNAKDLISNFLKYGNIKDYSNISIISFSNDISLEKDSAEKKNTLDSYFSNQEFNGGSALYDSFYSSLLETASDKQNKIVVGIIKSEDSKSLKTIDDVVEKSLELNIPIYILNLSEKENLYCKEIAKSTGGLYFSPKNLDQSENIIKSIIEREKKQITIEFISNKSKTLNNDNNSLSINFSNTNYYGSANRTYTINQVVNPNSQIPDEVLSNMTDLERAIYNYEYSFVKAVNSKDFSFLKSSLYENAPLWNDQLKLIENYKKRGIKEKLLHYKILNWNKTSDEKIEVTIKEQIRISYPDTKSYYREYENTYTLVNSETGYKIYSLDNINVIDELPFISKKEAGVLLP